MSTNIQRMSRPRRLLLAIAGVIAAAIVSVACASNGTTATPAGPHVAVWGFTAPWDKRSDSSLSANAAHLDVAVTGWIYLDSVSGSPSMLYRDAADLPAGTARFAIVTSGGGGHFHPDMVRRVAGEDSVRVAAAAQLAALVRRGSYRGLVFDLEGQSRADIPLVVELLRTLGDSARAAGAHTIALAIPAADTTAYPAHAFIPTVDALLVMLYDEHWPASPPGPVTSPDWAKRLLAQRVADVGASHIVAALPLYGYRWPTNQPGVSLGYADARNDASQAGVELARDPASLSLHAVKPGEWDLWASDAVQLRALRDTVASLGVSTIALWRIGLEDPDVWQSLSR